MQLPTNLYLYRKYCFNAHLDFQFLNKITNGNFPSLSLKSCHRTNRGANFPVVFETPRSSNLWKQNLNWNPHLNKRYISIVMQTLPSVVFTS